MTDKLTWTQKSTQWNGALGTHWDLAGLFIIRHQPETDEWVVTTSLPAHYRVGVKGSWQPTLEDAKREAEETLTEFYRLMKKSMEPAKPRKKADSDGATRRRADG